MSEKKKVLANMWRMPVEIREEVGVLKAGVKIQVSRKDKHKGFAKDAKQ